MQGHYDEILILDAAGKEIIGEERMLEIEVSLAVAGAWLSRIEPIRPLLDRLEKGGRYAAIAHDPDDEKIIFIRHDDTRAAVTPEGLARLFGV